MTYFLVEGPDSGDIVVNAMCQREMMSEVSDVHAQSGGVWIEEAEVVVIAELYEGLSLQGVVSGGTRVECVSGEVLGSLLKLRKWQILWN